MDDRDELHGAGWWQQMLTRREAGGRIARLAAGTLLLPALGSLTGCGDDQETLVESDALLLQKESGWNVGSEERLLAISDVSSDDSQGTTSWRSHTEPQKLLSDWGTRDARWQPFVVPTLVQSLSQPTLASAIKPVHTAKMDEAYSRGLGMREIILKSDKPEQFAIVADLPGPEAVAFAAALADVADPVLTFDNWPHPDGVVRAQQTLGALVYYADEVARKAAERTSSAAAKASGGKVPAVFVLDSERLTEPAASATEPFDNRYIAKLPEADFLKSANVATVVYAVPDATRTTELDDLNEYFANYRDGNVAVAMVPLSDFRPDTTLAAIDTTPSSTGATGTYRSGYHTPYYYGGGLAYAPLFFYTYPMFAYGAGAMPPYSRYSNVRVTRPTYTPARRATVFSSRTTGGAAGVGRTRPSGFGRVSRPASGGGSSFGGRRSSGSYGRARGGGSM